MGVSFRYWLRWMVELPRDYSLLPAVLTSGELRGIQAMEFPLYNLIFAPIFGLGIEWGRVVAQWSSLGLMMFLTYLSYRKWKSFFQDQEILQVSYLLLFLTGISGQYFYRFMPDYFAFILVMLGMGVGVSLKNYDRILAFVLCSLGLLVKPTAVVAFAPYLILFSWKEIFKKFSLFIIPSLVLTMIYYTFGISYLRSLSDQGEYFYTNFRNSIGQLQEFFSYPMLIMNLLMKHMFGAWGLVVILLQVFLTRSFRFNYWFVLLILQILTIAALDGHHSFIHDYYYIGTSFVVCVIIAHFLLDTTKIWFSYLWILLLFITNVERMFYEVRSVFTNNLWKECSEIKKSLPNVPWDQGYPFRSVQGHTPYLGLCFGERQGSKNSSFGLYLKEQSFNNECHLIKEALSEEINVVFCKNQ